MSLSYYYALLKQKQSELSRLQTCDHQLQNKQQDFFHYETDVLHPELSTSTWQGQLANQFNEIRTEKMLVQYNDMKIKQFDNTFTAIDQKIKQLEAEIRSIQNMILSYEAELAKKKTK